MKRHITMENHGALPAWLAPLYKADRYGGMVRDDNRHPWPMWYQWRVDEVVPEYFEGKRSRFLDRDLVLDEQQLHTNDHEIRLLSPGLTFVEAAHQALPGGLSERDHGNGLSTALRDAIGLGLRFDPGDFEWLTYRHGWPWSTDKQATEWTYTRACGAVHGGRQNVSAARAFEQHVGRSPFMASGTILADTSAKSLRRVAVGSTIYWTADERPEGTRPWLTVTSLGDDSLVAVRYREREREERVFLAFARGDESGAHPRGVGMSAPEAMSCALRHDEALVDSDAELVTNTIDVRPRDYRRKVISRVRIGRAELREVTR